MIRRNVKLGVVGFVAVVIGFICKVFYRPFINLNEINDFGIAGFLPSYFYVLGFALLLLIRPIRYSAIVISIVTLASILFEFKQYTSTGIFDTYDMLASVAGGLTACLFTRIIKK